MYLHNAPYSGMWEIPYGLGSYSNPVEQPNSAWPTDPETPESYTTPSQSYVDDLDVFFYGYDNTDLYETGLQEYGEITVTNASGSASYLNQAALYSAFYDGTVGNEGVGSELTVEQKQAVTSFVEDTAGCAYNDSKEHFVNESYHDDWTDWLNPGSYGFWWGLHLYNLTHFNEANELKRKERTILGNSIVQNNSSTSVQQYQNTYKAPTETVCAIEDLVKVDMLFIEIASTTPSPKTHIPVSKVYPPKYPPNNGFVPGTEYYKTLSVGEIIERRGSESGVYVAPLNSDFNKLGLQEIRRYGNVQRFKVKKEITVKAGTAANAFGQENGGGIQYLLDKSIRYYRYQGYLERIE